MSTARRREWKMWVFRTSAYFHFNAPLVKDHADDHKRNYPDQKPPSPDHSRPCRAADRRTLHQQSQRTRSARPRRTSQQPDGTASLSVNIWLASRHRSRHAQVAPRDRHAHADRQQPRQCRQWLQIAGKLVSDDVPGSSVELNASKIKGTAAMMMDRPQATCRNNPIG